MRKVLCCVLAMLLALAGMSALAVEIGTTMMVVNCNEYITLREEPDTSATALARMPLGEKGMVFLSEADNGFWQVSYKGQTGYALAKYLKPMGTFEGRRYDPSAKERYNFNLFLSNFTETGFLWRSGCFSKAFPIDTALLTEFAINHCWFNRQNRLEWAEDSYFNGNNVRLPENQIAPIVKKYFGESIKPSHNLAYIDYRNGYYYWEETGGHTSDGFACLTGVERLDDTRFCVAFNIYGAGESWDNDVCYYTAQQAAKAYPPYGSSTYYGRAVIDTGSSGTGDRSGWSLEFIAINREFD